MDFKDYQFSFHSFRMKLNIIFIAVGFFKRLWASGYNVPSWGLSTKESRNGGNNQQQFGSNSFEEGSQQFVEEPSNGEECVGTAIKEKLNRTTSSNGGTC